MDKSYQIVNEYLTKDDVHNKYGDVSFAYTQKQGEKYKVIAVSALEQQYLKSELLIDKVNFCGTDTVQNLEYLFGVI